MPNDFFSHMAPNNLPHSLSVFLLILGNALLYLSWCIINRYPVQGPCDDHDRNEEPQLSAGKIIWEYTAKALADWETLQFDDKAAFSGLFVLNLNSCHSGPQSSITSEIWNLASAIYFFGSTTWFIIIPVGFVGRSGCEFQIFFIRRQKILSLLVETHLCY